MLIRIKLLGPFTRIKSLEPVLLERLHQYSLSHPQPVVQRQQLRIVLCQFLRRHGAERAVEVVDAVDEVLGEALERKVFGCLYFAFRLVLEVAVVGYLALISVL